MAIHSANQKIKNLKFETGGTLDTSNAKHLIRIQVKTANYQVTEADSGTYFTTYGDSGTITYTLPANPKAGLFYYFFQSINNTITINSAAADGIITFDDLDADGVTAVTGSELTGALFFIFADGNIWNAACISNGTTLTVTT